MPTYKNMHPVDLANGQARQVNIGTIYQGDSYANRIGAIVTENGFPVSLGGTCHGKVVQTIEGTTVLLENGVVDGNKAYCDLTPECYDSEGPVEIHIKWTNGTETAELLFANGYLKKTETDEVVDPSGRVTISVETLIHDIAEAEATIPEDYSILSNHVDSLTHIDLTESGYINGSGADVDQSTYRRTGYIPIASDSLLVLDGFYVGSTSGSAYAYYFYAADKTPISGANGITTKTVVSVIPSNAAYVRFSSRISQGETPVAYVSNHVVEDMANMKPRMDAAEADVADLKSAFIAGFSGEQLLFISVDTSMDDFSAGPINSSGQPISQTNPASFHSGLREIGEASHLKSTMALISDSPQYYHYINFYSGNDFSSYLSRVGGKEYVVNANVPDGALYYAVTLTYIKNNNIQSYSLEKYIVNAIAVSPKNKWYVLGDSISAGYYSMTASMAQAAGVTLDYTSPVTTDQGETTGSVWDSSLEHNYWGYANKWHLRRQLVGKAIPGQGYYHKANYNNKNGVNVVNENDFSDAGLITVAWGFNDWHYNMSRGNHDLIDPALPYPTEGFDTSLINTINKAIWYCLGELIRKAPNAKIVVQTPMNGWTYGGDWSTNWSIGYTMSNSGKLSDIYDDIVYWANYYGLQIMDMTYNNSVVNRRNIKDTIIDGSHPSDQAHQQLGRHVAIALKYC